MYTFCGVEAESELHFFLKCQFSRAVYFGSRWGMCLDSVQVNNMEILMWWLLDDSNGHKRGGSEKNLFVLIKASVWKTKFTVAVELLEL